MQPSATGHSVSMVAHTAAVRRTVREPARSLNFLGFTGLAEWVGLGDVLDRRRSGSLQLGHLRTLDPSRGGRPRRQCG